MINKEGMHQNLFHILGRKTTLVCVMVNVLAVSAVDPRGFEPRSGQTKD